MDYYPSKKHGQFTATPYHEREHDLHCPCMVENPVTINSPLDLVEKLTGVRPRSGVCIFCKKNLTTEDKDHSVCNSCWTATFACDICGDETGECEHNE